MKRDVAAGYTETVCFSCSNVQDTQTKQVAITLISCLNTLSVISSPTSSAIEGYNTSPNTITVSTSWSNFFQTSDSTNCPITSCSLSLRGCTGSPTYSSMSSSSPFGITSQRNVQAGYTEQLCVTCTNLQDSINYDLLVVEQKNCGSALSIASPALSSHSMVWSSSPSSETIASSYSSIIANADTTYCPIS